MAFFFCNLFSRKSCEKHLWWQVIREEVIRCRRRVYHYSCVDLLFSFEYEAGHRHFTADHCHEFIVWICGWPFPSPVWLVIIITHHSHCHYRNIYRQKTGRNHSRGKTEKRIWVVCIDNGHLHHHTWAVCEITESIRRNFYT